MEKESITRRKFLQSTGLGAAGLTIAPFAIGMKQGETGMEASANNPHNKLQTRARQKLTILLADDKYILYRPGTKRTLNEPKRYEKNPVIARTKPWEKTIAYCSIHRNEQTGKYQLWYQSYSDHGAYLSYAVSNDGINWVKPSLGLIPYHGNKGNNLVMHIGYGGSVIFDPYDPDQNRRYKSVFWKQNKKPFGMSIAFSPDGIHWSKYENNSVINGSYGDYKPPLFADNPLIDYGDVGQSLSTSDSNALIWDSNRQVYAVYAKTWIDGPKGFTYWKRAVVRTESKDFVHWTKPQLVMAVDFDDIKQSGHKMSSKVSGGSGGVQFHNGPAFCYNSMYFSLLQVMNPHGAGNMPIELAISYDGYAWQRPFRNKYFIPTLEDKTKFDASLIWSNATPVYVKDEIRFYYGAYSTSWNDIDYKDTISGIGFVTIQRDRFAGIKPINKAGQVTFKTEDLTNCKAIILNADVSVGTIRAELLDTKGYRVRGYCKDDAVVIRGDSLRHKIVWQDRNIAQLTGSYKIRLHLEEAEVFSLTLKY